MDSNVHTIQQPFIGKTMTKIKEKSKQQKSCIIRITKALHVLCQLALWGLLAYFMFKCFKKYDDWPTYNEVHVLRQNNTKVSEFPDITICSGDIGGLDQGILLVSRQ